MTGPSRGSCSVTCRARPSNTTPRPGRDRTTRCTYSTGSSTRSPRLRQRAEERHQMPRRDDIHKILLLGSGPIVIGQAAEFDYSGTQACRVLEADGSEGGRGTSNPATIMNDPEGAAATYIEPLL